MVVRVRMRGLNVRQSRGKWYVSIRATGDSLLRGFEGSRADLTARLEQPDMMQAYTRHLTRERRPVYERGTVGELAHWFQHECPRWDKLSQPTRNDYEKTFRYLEPEFDMEVAEIEQADIYDLRNVAAKKKWPRFADKMVSHLSTLFREGMKVRRADRNPAAGVEKIHDADPNANHEWFEHEVAAAISAAPRHILTPILLARYQGFRGQTIAALRWSAYAADPTFGKCFNVVLRKNKLASWFPARAVVRLHLDRLDRTAVSICTNQDGLPWPSEKTMQGAVSDFLDRLKAADVIRRGCTLHGLRTTYAAAIKRDGYDDAAVADALGDKSQAMGTHYTRHVERETTLRKIFGADVVQNTSFSGGFDGV